MYHTIVTGMLQADKDFVEIEVAPESYHRNLQRFYLIFTGL